VQITGKLPEQILRQVQGLDTVFQGTEKLLKVEQVLSVNLKTLATAEGFKKLFASLNTLVNRLSPALEKLDKRIDEICLSLEEARAHRNWRLPFFGGRGRMGVNDDH
jgi:ribosome-associated translation inhibitor RaiA